MPFRSAALPVLTAEKIALSGPLAFGKPRLRLAGEALPKLLVFLRPRPRRLDGRRLRRIGTFGLAADPGLFDPGGGTGLRIKSGGGFLRHVRRGR